MKSTYVIFVALLALTSCGRHQHGYIINNSDDTLMVEFEIRDSTLRGHTNYFYYSILQHSRSSEKNFKLPGDLLVNVDTAGKTATLRFMPGNKLSLGTVRVDESRDDYRCWEFRGIKIYNGHNLLEAKNKGIMRLVKKEFSFFTQDTHFLYIGMKE